MKVLFLIGSLSLGGAERMVARVANSLANDNYEIFININCDNVKYPLSKNVKLNKILEKSHIQRILKLRKYVKKIDPDVIIPFLEYNCALAVLALQFTKYRNRVVSAIRNNMKYSDFSVFFNYFYLKLSHLCLFQNHGESTQFPRLPQNKIRIIPNFIDESFFKKHKYDLNNKKIKCVAIGRFVEQKNFLLLISSVLPIKNKITLNIYGDGPLQNEMETLIMKLNLKDCVFINKRNKNIIKVLEENDIFILSSIYEGMPNVLLEAMAMGLCAISNDCDFGPRDIIENGVNGILLNNFKEQLPSTIESLYNNRQTIKVIGEKAQKHAFMNYREEIVMSKWKVLLKEFDNN